MCSIGEDDFGDEGGAHAMLKDTKFPEDDIISGMCKKCNKNEAVVKMDFKEPECRDCFLESVLHKFRATLGISKILPKEADVLVIFDGSAESIVLLDMIHFAVTQNNFKRLRCRPHILYIDENISFDSKRNSLAVVKEIVSSYNLKAYVVSLASESVPIDLKDFNHPIAYKESKETFEQQLRNIKSLTSQQDFISKTRYNRIKLSAEQLGCKFVLLSDITSSLATTFLSDVILGRGGSTSLNVSFLDDRNEHLKIIRPIKDLSTKEVATYVRLNCLKHLGRCTFGEKSGPNASLQNLTEVFIKNLQNNFSSTVSTVFKTGDKLAPTVISQADEGLNETVGNVCAFCHSTLDYFNSKTLFAIEFSRLVSNTASDQLSDLENLEKLAKSQLEATENSFFKCLCHGCRNICADYPEFLEHNKYVA